MLYLWLKTLHIISVIAWMAGLFYLPRLFVYHAGVPAGSERDKMLQVMEVRLLRIIMGPAMISTWVTGLALSLETGCWQGPGNGWWHLKVVLVLALSAFHGLCARWRKDFVAGCHFRSHRFFRLANEIPTLLMSGIVALVVFRMF